MPIAYLSSFFPSLTETFIYREVFELRRRNIRVRTYSLRRPGINAISGEAVPLYLDTYYLLPVDAFDLCRSHLRFFLRSPLRYVRTLFRMVAGRHCRLGDRVRSLMHFGEGVVLAGKMVDDNISHIHAHYASQPASVARVIHLLTGLSYSFTGHAHDIWHDRLLLPQKLEEVLFAATCSRIGKEWLVKQAGGRYADKISVVYHGLDVREFSFEDSPPKGTEHLILSIGRLTEQKGFPDLMAACAMLRERGFRFRCTIIGEGEDRQQLEALIRSLRLEGLVVLSGAEPQEAVRQYYQRAHVFALPCVDTREGNRDGIPNVLMEAMAVGVPVVTTDNAGQSELIEDGVHGLLVPSHAPDRLADAIHRVCTDEILRERIRRKARERMVGQFDNRKTVEPLLALLSQVERRDSVCGKRRKSFLWFL